MVHPDRVLVKTSSDNSRWQTERCSDDQSSWSLYTSKVIYRRSGNFRCKNIFVVCANHENKKHEIYFTIDNHYSQNIFVHTISQRSQLVVSRETVSSIPGCHSSSWQTRDNFRSVSDKPLLLQYVPMALLDSLLHASNSPTAA